MPFGILSGLLQTGMDYGMSKIARQDNYDYWKRSNDRMFAQQQKAEQLSVRNRAEGLKMAGLNPSLAGQSSPMAIGAAPSRKSAKTFGPNASERIAPPTPEEEE